MDTRTHILDTGEALMKRTGYSGFSYAEIASAVGIRKASIHYHFPSKADLAQAAVDRYRERMKAALEGPVDSPKHAVAILQGVFEAAFAGPGGGCLCGSLAADWPALPEAVQAGVAAYWSETEAWIAAAVPDADEPARLARLIFALFEGAMMSARISGDAGVFADVAAAAGVLIDRHT